MQCVAFMRLPALLPLRRANMPLERRQQLPSPCTERFLLVCKRAGDTLQHVVRQACMRSQGLGNFLKFCRWRDSPCRMQITRQPPVEWHPRPIASQTRPLRARYCRRAEDTMQHMMGLIFTWRQQLLAEQTVSDEADCRELDSRPEQPTLVCRQAEYPVQAVVGWMQPRARRASQSLSAGGRWTICSMQ